MEKKEKEVKAYVIKTAIHTEHKLWFLTLHKKKSEKKIPRTHENGVETSIFLTKQGI